MDGLFAAVLIDILKYCTYLLGLRVKQQVVAPFSRTFRSTGQCGLQPQIPIFEEIRDGRHGDPQD